MPILQFRFLPSVDSNDHQARVLVDGRDLLESIDKTALGIDPAEFFAQPALRAEGELLIGRCSCGCVGCGDESVTVERTGDLVIWASSHPWMRRLEFEATAYDCAIELGARDTSWETVERTAERLVGALDFSGFDRRGLFFQWASGRLDQNTLHLSFSEGTTQRLFSVRWDHADPKGAVLAVRKFIEEEA